MKKTYLLLFGLFLFLHLFASDEKEIKKLVHSWNKLHNTRQPDAFASLYAERVLYYGRNYSRAKCVERKASFLRSSFSQQIVSPLSFTYYNTGIIKCDFTKTTRAGKVMNDHHCYLLFKKENGKWCISGESDIVTDEKRDVVLNLGKQVSKNKSVPLVALGMGVLLGGGLFVYKRKRKKTDRSFFDDHLDRHVELPDSVIPERMEVNAAGELTDKIKTSVGQELKETDQEGPTSKEKGDLFERFVVERFKQDYFTLLEWRSDKFHEGHYAVSSRLPDLEFEFETKRYKLRFAVECKWRAEFKKNSIEWAKDYQLRNYQGYEKREGVKVFVIIGIGGEPNNPDSLYIVPLADIHSTVLPQTWLQKYYRYGKGNFFLHAEAMMLQ